MPCFNEKIEAWDFGPVVPRAYREFKQFGSGNIPPIKSYLEAVDENDVWNMRRISFKDNRIMEKDKKKIDAVVDLFSGYSAMSLVALTQMQAPWINAYNPHQRNEITNDAIREYFSNRF